MRNYLFKICLSVSCFVASAMAVNLQNVQLDGSFKSKQKSIARLKSDVEANEEIDASRKDRLLQDIQSIEADFSNWNAVEETCPKTPQKELLSDECEEFYDDAWPKLKVRIKMAFIDFKIAQLDAVKKSGDQRKFVKSCIENIGSTDFHLSNYQTGIKLGLKEELLEDGYRVKYYVSAVGPKKSMTEVWLDSLGKRCLDVLVDKTRKSPEVYGRDAIGGSTYFWSDYAIGELVKFNEKNTSGKYYLQWWNESYLRSYCDEKYPAKNYSHKKVDKDYEECMALNNEMKEKFHFIDWGDKIIVYNTINPMKFSFYLNGQEIFSCKKEKNSIVNVLGFKRYDGEDHLMDASSATAMTCSCINGFFYKEDSGIRKCSGSIIVSDDEIKRGLLGTMIWNDQGKIKGTEPNCDDPTLTPKEQKKCKLRSGK